MHLSLGNDEMERHQAWSTEGYWSVERSQPHHRHFPDFRRAMGGPRAADSKVCEHLSVWRRTAPGFPTVPVATVFSLSCAQAASGRRWTPQASGVIAVSMVACLAWGFSLPDMAHLITWCSRLLDSQYPGLVCQIVEYFKAVSQSPSYLKRTPHSSQAASKISRVAKDVGVTI